MKELFVVKAVATTPDRTGVLWLKYSDGSWVNVYSSGNVCLAYLAYWRNPDADKVVYRRADSARFKIRREPCNRAGKPQYCWKVYDNQKRLTTTHSTSLNNALSIVNFNLNMAAVISQAIKYGRGYPLG